MESTFGWRPALAWIGLACLCFPTLGCGGSQTDSAPQEESHIKVLAVYYGQFTGRNRGRPPADEKQLRDYITAKSSEMVERVGGVDQVFISERDNKPFVIVYAKDKKPGSNVIAYEQDGVDGKRFIADDLAVVEELDEEQFRARVPGAQ